MSTITNSRDGIKLFKPVVCLEWCKEFMGNRFGLGKVGTRRVHTIIGQCNRKRKIQVFC